MSTGTRGQITAGQAVIVVSIDNQIQNALKKVEAQVRKFAAGIGQIGFDLFRGGLLGSIPVFASVVEFQKFEDEILRLGTKLQTTDRILARVEDRIRSLGKTTSFTALEVAQGATSLAQAGLSPEEVMGGLQAVLDLGRGAKITLDEAADLLANTSATFKLPVNQFDEIASQFIATARLSTIEVINLKEAIKEASGTLNDLNVDLPTSLALLAQLGFRSLKGTKAGTTLNTMLLNLVAKMKQIGKVLNVEVSNIDGSMRPLLEVLDEFSTKIKKLPETQRIRLSQQLFNIRGSRGETALREIDKIRRLAQEIRTAGDEARIAAQKMDSGLGGSVRRATSAINDFAISLGKNLSPTLQRLLDLVPALVASLDELVTKFPLLTTYILALPPGILAVGTGLLVASFALGKFATLLGVVGSGAGLAFKTLTSFGAGLKSSINTPILLAVTSLASLDRKLAEVIFGKGKGRRRRPKSLFNAQLFGPQINLTKIGKALSASFIAVRNVAGTAFIAPINALAGFVKIIVKAIQLLAAYNKVVGLIVLTQAKIKNVRYLILLLKIMVQNGTAAASTASSIARLQIVLGNLLLRLSKLQTIQKGLGFGAQLKGLAGILGKGFVKTLATVWKLITNVASGLLKLTNIILKGKWITTLYKGFMSAGGALALFLRGTLGFGKFLFSFNGIFQIATWLYLLGDSLDFTKAILDSFRRGFSNFGKELGDIGRLIGPAFTQIGNGFSLILQGDGQAGVEQLIAGLKNVASIITNQVLAGFNKLIVELSPGLEFLYGFFKSLWELLKLVGASASAIATPFQEIGKFSDKSLSDKLFEIFSLSNMVEGFKELGLYVEGFATALANLAKTGFEYLGNAIRFLTDTLAEVLGALRDFIQARNVAGIFNSEVASLSAKTATIFQSGFELQRGFKDAATAMEKVPAQIAQAGNRFQDAMDKLEADVTGSMKAAAEARAREQKNAAGAAANRATLSNLFSDTLKTVGRFGTGTMGAPQIDPNWSWAKWMNVGTQGAQTLTKFTGVEVNKELSAATKSLNAVGQALPKPITDGLKGAFKNPLGALAKGAAVLADPLKLIGGPIAEGAAALAKSVGDDVAESTSLPEMKGLYGSIVGSFQETRGALMAAKGEPEKQTELLKGIRSGISQGLVDGGPDATPFLKQIRDKDTSPRFE